MWQHWQRWDMPGRTPWGSLVMCLTLCWTPLWWVLMLLLLSTPTVWMPMHGVRAPHWWTLSWPFDAASLSANRRNDYHRGYLWMLGGFSLIWLCSCLDGEWVGAQPLTLGEAQKWSQLCTGPVDWAWLGCTVLHPCLWGAVVHSHLLGPSDGD